MTEVRVFIGCLFFVLFTTTFVDLSHAEILLSKPEILENNECVLYIPSGLAADKKYPLVIALSPSADAHSMIETWIGVAEKHKWLILASKEFKNGIDMGPVLERIMTNVAILSMQFPIDQQRLIATGFSGGGMGAHALSFLYPKLICAVVVNTGMINDYFILKRKMYERGKLAVFLASPTDSRYENMKRDRIFLEGLGWKIKWLEFQGGHTLAPFSEYEKAAEWLEAQIKTY